MSIVMSGRSRPIVVVKKKKSPNRAVNPSLAAIKYNGPVTLPKGISDMTCETVQLGLYGSIATSAGGVISTVFDAYSQASTSNDWSSLTALWQEYRILSFHVKVVPWSKYNWPTTDSLAPVLSITARDNATALATLADTATYDSVEIHDPSTKFSRSIKMDGADEASWTVTSGGPSAASRLYVKLYSSGNVASKTTHDYLSFTLVQFRGRK